MIARQPIPAVAYVRRSTDRQEQSLGDQRKEITRWAQANGYAITAEYVDDAISGTTTKSRPGFQQMIADAGKGTFKAVIVWSSDRFSRADVTETEHYRFVLREAGVEVLSVTEDYLAKDDMAGEVLRVVRQSQNRAYSVALSQNTLRGQVSSVLSGSDCGRMPPFGYDREVVNADGGVAYRVRFMPGGQRLMLDRHGDVQSTHAKGESLRKPSKSQSARLVLSTPDRVQVVRDIFEACTEGRGFKTIADELNRRGIMSPKGKLWQHTTVKAMIENPTYRGDLTWNRRTESKFYEVRERRADRQKVRARSGRIEKVSRDDWIVIDNAVPAIVERDLWDKAQQAASARAAYADGRGKQSCRWLLSGVMKCACCGQPFVGSRKRKGKVAEGRAPVVKNYYVCNGRVRHGKSTCPVSVHVNADGLEAWVLQQVRAAVLGDGEGVADAVDRFVAETMSGSAATDVSPLEAELAQIDSTVAALMTGLDPANLPLINGQLTQLRRRKEALQQQLRAARSCAATDEAGLRRWAAERLGLLAEMIKGRRDEKARQVIASYIDEIVIDPAGRTGELVFNAAVVGDFEDASVGGTGTTRVTEPGTQDSSLDSSLPAVAGTPPTSPASLDGATTPPPPSAGAPRPDVAPDGADSAPLACLPGVTPPPPPKPNNPPQWDGSQVSVIAGARVGTNPRPRGRRRVQFGLEVALGSMVHE